MKEYELYVPLRYNDGSRIEPEKLQHIKVRLLDRFGGLTFIPQPREGYWKYGGVTYRDSIVIYRVVTPDAEGARRFFQQLKEQLKEELAQEEILIIEKDANVL